MITNFKIFENNEQDLKTIFDDLNRGNQIDYDLIDKYIEDGNDIDVVFQGNTLLTLACITNNDVVVDTLIKADADLNLTDENYKTPPLLYTASNGYVDLTLKLIKAGADINSTDNEGVTPLIAAAQVYSQFRTIKILLDAEADFTVDDSGKCFFDYIFSNLNSFSKLKTEVDDLIKEYPNYYKKYLILNKKRDFNL